jgi:hypothetical protein
MSEAYKTNCNTSCYKCFVSLIFWLHLLCSVSTLHVISKKILNYNTSFLTFSHSPPEYLKIVFPMVFECPVVRSVLASSSSPATWRARVNSGHHGLVLGEVLAPGKELSMRAAGDVAVTTFPRGPLCRSIDHCRPPPPPRRSQPMCVVWKFGVGKNFRVKICPAQNPVDYRGEMSLFNKLSLSRWLGVRNCSRELNL